MFNVNQLIGFGATNSTPPAWYTVFTQTLNTNSSSPAGYCFRQTVAISNLGISTTKVRVSISGNTSSSSTVSNWSIGVTDVAPNTVATPVELLISSASGFNLSAGASAVSDEATFSLTGSETNLTIVFDLANGNTRHNNSSSNTLYYKAATASYNQSSVTGFAGTANQASFVTKIELYG